MNDTLLARSLAEILAADPELAAPYTPEAEGAVPNITHQQSAALLTARPSIVIAGDYQHHGPRRLGIVTFELLGRVADPAGHADRVDALWNKLLGAPGETAEESAANKTAAKAAMKAAIATAGAAELLEYGPAVDTMLAGAEGEDLRTTLNLRVAWRFV